MKCKNCVYNITNKENDEKYSWCVVKNANTDIEIERECENFLCMTNADRIRKMTDEELSEFWESKCDEVIDCKFCEEPRNEYGSCTGQCRNEYLHWLQEEVE